MSKIILGYAIVAVTAVAIGSTYIWQEQPSDNKKIQKEIAFKPSVKFEDLDSRNELASNDRMASIAAYYITKGYSLDSLATYLSYLSKAYKSDYLDDNIYARLAAFGANIEFQPSDIHHKIIRDKWFATIEQGSHFDLHPTGRLVMPAESVPAPQCKQEKQPYVAYVLATPLSLSEQISGLNVVVEPADSAFPQYRFLLKDQQNNEMMFNTQYRILVDVGCTDRQTDNKTNELKSMTN